MPTLPSASRTLVMGVLNVTPDSFSDGGRWASADAAIDRGLRLAADGADLVDVGGESTRPGASRVDADEEIARVLPVVTALTEQSVPVSIDTMRARTARAAVDAGACLVNDVSGGLADPAMAATVAELDVDYVAMHWRAHSDQMDQWDRYTDVIAEVKRELALRVEALAEAGVDPARIILDPGLGFAKVGASNWTLLADAMSLGADGMRVLIGASRKRFLTAATVRSGVQEHGPADRDSATTAVTALVAQRGAWGVRVHDARAARDAVEVVSGWQNAQHTQE